MVEGCSDPGHQDCVPDSTGDDPGSGNYHTGGLADRDRDGCSGRSSVDPDQCCRPAGSSGGGITMEDKNIMEDIQLKENEEISEETVRELSDNKGDDE